MGGDRPAGTRHNPAPEASPRNQPVTEAAGSPGTREPRSAAWAVRAGDRAARWAWWVQVSVLYIAARLVSASIFMAAALHQGVNPWFPAKPDYWSFVNIWDARWYGEILQNGYPEVLPTDGAGTVQENAWAFYALFPFLGRALAGLTGMHPAFSMTLIAMVAGLGAALVIYRLFRRRASHGTALWATVFVATFPVSPVLQVPYAESLNLLLLAAALLLVVERRYLWAMPVVVLMCLSRPTGVPFAAMVGLLFLYRLWQARAAARPAPSGTKQSGTKQAGTKQAGTGQSGTGQAAAPHTRSQLWSLAGLTAVSGMAALMWPAIAWAVTGDIRAYTKTETVWRGHDLVPFKPWFDTGVLLFGPVLGILAPFVFAALFALFMMCRPVRALGTELRLWCVCYMGYLLLFLHPQTSTFRMLLPLFPLALSAALISRSRAYRGTVVVMFVLLQIVWIVWLWAWAPLPGGGDYPP
ncbi:glycosyltransferase family 39 protein [Arthrobacter sp. EPSL27]|uniref:glycosyltransferase family 39 protein n=1 Tax=Arthrobacter sp. EPSL27 TaxID=1745378 RepID=UPI0009EC41AB|nr:glycosyltransferase family 39 protein [Arthrobacter sp. EPSL27]